ncbi:MAG: PAS domain S-box protein, partial [Burkholderiales bacterium]
MGAQANAEHASEHPPDQGSSFRLAAVIWPQITACAVLLLMGALSIWLLSALRAYVAGEGGWSKAQKQAVIELLEYVDSPEPAKLERFQLSLRIPLADARARAELDAETPDLEFARSSLLIGHHPSDINGLITL